MSKDQPKPWHGRCSDANLSPCEIDYINAHGTGTQANDVTESQAIRDGFRENAGKLLVSSTKSMHGHTLGAAGAIEAIASLLALQHGLVPPTANFTSPDPACCNLDVVPNTSSPCEHRNGYFKYICLRRFKCHAGNETCLTFTRCMFRNPRI